jgi:hypothetical protein
MLVPMPMPVRVPTLPKASRIHFLPLATCEQTSFLKHCPADDAIKADRLRKQASAIDEEEEVDQSNSAFQDDLEGAATNSAATSDASESGRLQGQKYIQHHRSAILGADMNKVPSCPSNVHYYLGFETRFEDQPVSSCCHIASATCHTKSQEFSDVTLVTCRSWKLPIGPSSRFYSSSSFVASSPFASPISSSFR